MAPREAYLMTLRLELADLPATLAEDMIGDLDAHFRDALAAGKGEAEAAQRLGDPVRLAHDLRVAVGVEA
jgi:uncharacterized membrane protein